MYPRVFRTLPLLASVALFAAACQDAPTGPVGQPGPSVAVLSSDSSESDPGDVTPQGTECVCDYTGKCVCWETSGEKCEENETSVIGCDGGTGGGSGEDQGISPGEEDAYWSEGVDLGPEHFEMVGLCNKPRGRGIGICLESFISRPLYGAGDGRDPESAGGTYKTSARFSIDPKTGYISGTRLDIGKTFGLIPGEGGIALSRARSDGKGGWIVQVKGSARQKEAAFLGNINFHFRIHVDQNGVVRPAGGTHDGFPSFELWSYPTNSGNPALVYHHKETNLGDLYGCCDVAIPDNSP